MNSSRIFARFFALPFAVTALCASPDAQAQIVLDGTMGTGGALAGPNYQIGANLGQTYGNNLFHSFSQFNLSQGQSANFSGPASIQNILSRVTGGAPSTIDGTLRSSIAGANLFFLNPSGVVFGPNAAIDVSGSFVVSTADVLKLQNGGSFHAKNPSLSVLSSAPPAAFGFLNQNPSPIRINGSQLTMAPGKNLTLVGGHISTTGALITAPGGQIGMVSVGSPGDVQLNGTRPGLAQGFDQLGNISLNGTVLNVGQVGASTSFGDVAGSVNLRGQNLTLNNESRILATNTGDVSGGVVGIDLDGTLQIKGNSHIVSETYGSGHGADVSIKARDILQGLRSTISTVTTGIENGGDGGNIKIKTGSLDIKNEGQILADTHGSGRGGLIEIKAGSILIDGQGAIGEDAVTGISAVTASSFSDSPNGNGGRISIETEKLTIGKDGIIAAGTTGHGNGGDISIKANSILLQGGDIGSITVAETNGGNAGHIEIQAESLKLEEGGAISANTIGSGAGGDISIKANRVVLDGKEGGNFTGIFAESIDAGDSGSIKVEADSIQLLNEALIDVTTEGAGKGGNIILRASDVLHIQSDAAISANTGGKGQGGDISIEAQRVILDGKEGKDFTGIFANSFAEGDSGSIKVEAGSIQLLNEALIDVSTRGDGRGGNIILRADDTLHVQSGAGISANTIGKGQGGDISIQASRIVVDGKDSSLFTGIFAESAGAGKGGSIQIEADSLHVRGSSQISASTGNSGQGGDICIKAQSIILDGKNNDKSSGVFAESFGTGVGGSIKVKAGSIQLLNEALIDATTTGQGKGGSIILDIDDALHIQSGSEIGANAGGSGEGGSISVKAKRVIIDGKDSEDFTGIFAVNGGLGDSNSIQVEADSLQLLNGAYIDATTVGGGKGGSITLRIGGTLRVENGSQISASTFSSGNGGDIFIKTRRLILDGKNSDLFTGILAGSAAVPNAGDSGNVQVEADSIVLNQAEININTRGEGNGGDIVLQVKDSLNLDKQSGIIADTFGAGRGGDIIVEAGSVSLTNSATIEAAAAHDVQQGVGDAGSIKITARDNISLSGRASIFAEGLASNGGNLSLRAGDSISLQNSSISTIAGGNGGGIQLNAGRLLRLNDSIVAAAAIRGMGGNISINDLTPNARFVIFDKSLVSAEADLGNGGDISIRSNVFIKSAESLVTASSRLGIDGNIAIESPNTNVGGSLLQLPNNLLGAENYLSERCTVRLTGQKSSFTINTRRALPPLPGTFLPSNVASK